MNKLQLLAIACCAAFTSCTVHDRMVFSDNITRGVRLAEATTEDGTREIWRAYPGNDTNPRIEMTSTKTQTVPHFGVYAEDVDRKRAKATGATPWQGVWISRVANGEPADRAGIARGDIILQLNGKDVTSTEQFLDLIANSDVEQPASLLVRQHRKAGTAIDSERVVTIEVKAKGKKVRKSTTDSIPLEHSKGVQTYTGLQVAMVDTDLAKKIYGSNEAITLVTGVVTGSPAYDAGLRAGDRVTKVDGSPVQSVQDVRDAVLSRVQSLTPNAPTYDLATSRTTPLTSGLRSDGIMFEVDGPLGIHQTTMEVSDSITDRSRFYIPIIANYTSHANRTRVGFLNFIFQFGFNYRSRVYPSATRARNETSHLSILPLGMFEISHGVNNSRYRLFWLINFGSDN